MDLLALYERMLASEERHRNNVARLWYLFGQKVRDRRVERKVSLRETAHRMGISAPTLSDLELGRRRWTADRLKQFLSIIQDNHE